ncbi:MULTISPECIES: lysozyme inhibitor LprI family protein [Dickeya]|uniref:DUF1311 domain-containing protein n=2 Tax=Dickeya TaxID=204037 RepID=A0AAE7CY30_9GAMM|nr:MULTISPECIES: hypothetical protein [Dickeya]MCA6995593.1 hypothetical protein [Dickeya oryzae]QIZ49509.1 hypothetical protein DWG24_01295 [Dickeya zeae]QYM93199.1 hypothetical protein FGI21_15720 [Dickeya zeae]
MKRLLATWLLPLAVGCVALPSLAASFPCQQASSAQEKLICQTPALSQLDDELAKEWQKSRAFLTGNAERVAQDKILMQFQRSWLSSRNTCRDEECLRQSYQQQLSRLRYLNDVTLHTLPDPIARPRHNSCFDGDYSYEYYLQLPAQEYDELSDYFKEMYDQKAPYHLVNVTLNTEDGDITGNGSVAFRYATKLDDITLSARQMTDTQAIGQTESSFGGQKKLLLTCVDNRQLQITVFDAAGESYLFDYLMSRGK